MRFVFKKMNGGRMENGLDKVRSMDRKTYVMVQGGSDVGLLGGNGNG